MDTIEAMLPNEERSPRLWTAYALIVTVVILAWLPTYGPYSPVADDYPLSNRVKSNAHDYIQNWLGSQGAWRILGPPG